MPVPTDIFCGMRPDNWEHYRSLHPQELSPQHRQQCLFDLKEIGYQVGTGFMVGSPGQTFAHLAEDHPVPEKN